MTLSVVLIVVGTLLLAVAGGLLWTRRLGDVGHVLHRIPWRHGERRLDTSQRDRLTLLEARWRLLARSLTTAVVFVAVCSLLAGIGFVVLYGRLQDSRVRTLIEACEGRNAEHIAIQQFVGDSDPELADRTARAFPIEPDCDAYAKDRAKVK